MLEDLLAHAAGESRVGEWAKVGLRQQREAQGHIHAQRATKPEPSSCACLLPLQLTERIGRCAILIGVKLI